MEISPRHPSLASVGTDKALDHAFAQQSSLIKTAKIALFWRSGSQILAQFVSWASTLFVMRLLSPSDYGLFALSLIAQALLSCLAGTGIANALVQQRQLTHLRIRQAFGLLLCANISVATIQWCAAPYLAAYYHQPQLALMLRIQTLIPLATPFIALSEALMVRELRFQTQAIVSLSSTLLGALTSITLAHAHFGVWTLVIAPIVIFWARALSLIYLSRSLVWPSFAFTGCAPLFRFGGALFLSQAFWLIQTQSDVLIIGSSFTPHEIGIYAQAVLLATLFYGRFIPPLNDVAFPIYARLQDDLPALRRSFLNSVRSILLVAIPFYIGLAACARPLVNALFGPQWSELSQLMAIMAGGMPFMAVQILFAPVFNALGKPHISAYSALTGAIVFASSFAIAAPFGLSAIAVSWCVAAPLLFACTLTLARHSLDLSLSDFLAVSQRPALIGIAMGVSLNLVDHLWLSHQFSANAWLHLTVMIGFGVALYLALLIASTPSCLSSIKQLKRESFLPMHNDQTATKTRGEA